MSFSNGHVPRPAERQALAEQVAATPTDEVIRLRKVLESTACPTCQGVGRVPDLPLAGAEECSTCWGHGNLSRHREPAPETHPCHCGDEPQVHEGGFTRGLCRDCDSARCDAYPGACGR